MRLMEAGDLRPARLTTHRFELGDGTRAYEVLAGDEPSLGILLTYPGTADAGGRVVAMPARGSRLRRATRRAPPRVGGIGAGTSAPGAPVPHPPPGGAMPAIAAATAG